MSLDHQRHAIESYVILSDCIFHVIGSYFILLDRTSFYRIIFHVIGSDVMSLDQKRHSIGPASFLKKVFFFFPRVLL